MTKPVRIIRNIAIGVIALLIVLVVAAIFAVQTDWFRAYPEVVSAAVKKAE